MLNRRDFARLSVTGATATSHSIAAAAPRPNAIKPKRLAPGGTVGLVLPASAAFEADEIKFAKEQMEAIGFKVVIGPHAFDNGATSAPRSRRSHVYGDVLALTPAHTQAAPPFGHHVR
ncbi:MAG TPA: hypothetical protein VN380_15465 [Thermoanaerobaculia bacterium]|nr:hypothetical protein [Thermoanaerobaculia bacterium]